MDGPKRQQFMLTADVVPKVREVARERLSIRFFDDVLQRARLVDGQHGEAADAVRIDIALLDERRSAERRQPRAVEGDERAQYVTGVVIVGVQHEKWRLPHEPLRRTHGVRRAAGVLLDRQK